MTSRNRPARTGGEILVDALARQNVRHLFCVPGESFLAALDALHENTAITTVVCRQEGGAAMMAEAMAKLTGEPGVCFVTRGPGATNASSGMHVAAQDSTPMVLLIGQVGTDALSREAFQEIDYTRFYGAIAKHVEQVYDPARLPEIMSRAFHTACNGRPGPVVVVLPEDVLREYARVDDVPIRQTLHVEPAAGDIAAFGRLLSEAQRPLMIAGGRNWTPDARAALHRFVARWRLPVATAWRYHDVFDHADDHYIGDVGIGMNPEIERALQESDLVIALGIRLGEMTTKGYTRLKVPVPDQKLIHVFPSHEELGRVYYPTLAIAAGAPQVADALDTLDAPKAVVWLDHLKSLRDSYVRWTTPKVSTEKVNLAEVMSALDRIVSDDAIVCNGAGNNTGWLHRYFRFTGARRQLAPTSGSMGYGLPAAIAAALAYPDRQVIAVVGDGDLQMTSQELATVVQQHLSIVLLVVNNSMLGTIRMHQEMHYPGRTSNTDLHNPDFCKLAEAHGLLAARVTGTDQFGPALKKALDAKGATLIELVTGAEAISHSATLSDLRSR
ncbi:MAG: thiamine pyrophosphate-binding protein [Gammaproteobacteria bacterium]|nr:thiamine pyrophosphate-binding protein [Gammaproteobacteria bacterium]NDG44150.1 thiamine pyrophosphate-binding protein [Gammaproteobacteria bacterium]